MAVKAKLAVATPVGALRTENGAGLVRGLPDRDEEIDRGKKQPMPRYFFRDCRAFAAAR